MLAHVALQTLEANADAPGAEAVSIKVASQALHAGRHGAMQPADVVLTGARWGGCHCTASTCLFVDRQGARRPV